MSLKGRVSPELDAAWAEWAEGLTAYEIDHFQKEAIPVGIVWAENEIRRLRVENERLKERLTLRESNSDHCRKLLDGLTTKFLPEQLDDAMKQIACIVKEHGPIAVSPTIQASIDYSGHVVLREDYRTGNLVLEWEESLDKPRGER